MENEKLEIGDVVLFHTPEGDVPAVVMGSYEHASSRRVQLFVLHHGGTVSYIPGSTDGVDAGQWSRRDVLPDVLISDAPAAPILLP